MNWGLFWFWLGTPSKDFLSLKFIYNFLASKVETNHFCPNVGNNGDIIKFWKTHIWPWKNVVLLHQSANSFEMSDISSIQVQCVANKVELNVKICILLFPFQNRLTRFVCFKNKLPFFEFVVIHEWNWKYIGNFSITRTVKLGYNELMVIKNK